MRKSLTALALVGTLVALLGAAPVSATISGVTQTACQTTLPAWPTPSGTGTCSGNLTGANGAGAGLTTRNKPYVIYGVGGSYSASFTYNEPCTVKKQPPVIGFAKGTTTAGGLSANVNGKSTTATLTSNFKWTRVGLTAVVVLSGTKIAFGNGTAATAKAPEPAVGAFAPENYNPQTNACPVGAPLTAQVFGVSAGGA